MNRAILVLPAQFKLTPIQANVSIHVFSFGNNFSKDSDILIYLCRSP